MKIKPLNKWVLVQREKKEEKTVGGLYLPEDLKKKQDTAKVIAIGTLKLIKVGDTVLLNRFAGQEIQFEGQDYVLVKEDDVIAKVECSISPKPFDGILNPEAVIKLIPPRKD